MASGVWTELSVEAGPGSAEFDTVVNRELTPDQVVEHLEALVQTIKGEHHNSDKWWCQVAGISLEINRRHDLTIIRYHR